jgi:hypothetical protein
MFIQSQRRMNFFAVEWMELENIILCEVCQMQKDKIFMFSLICGIWIYTDKFYEKHMKLRAVTYKKVRVKEGN